MPPCPPDTPDTPDANAGAPLHQLVYCSRASDGLGDDDVHRILRSARRRNPMLGITGLLVLGSGIFFQWLEGPRDGIDTLMLRLRADPRHADIVVLDTTDAVRERLFPDWSMELVSAAHIREVLQDALADTRDAASTRTLRDLLRRLETGELSGLADL